MSGSKFGRPDLLCAAHRQIPRQRRGARRLQVTPAAAGHGARAAAAAAAALVAAGGARAAAVYPLQDLRAGLLLDIGLGGSGAGRGLWLCFWDELALTSLKHLHKSRFPILYTGKHAPSNCSKKQVIT